MRRALASAIAGLLITGALFVSFALGQDEPKTTPVILSPTNGAVVMSPVTVIVEFKDASSVMHDKATKSVTNSAMGQMGTMHGDEHHYGAHPHLIVDSPLPRAGTTVPMDAKHIHLMHGETRSVLNLKPGEHTLQLIMGDENHMIGASTVATSGRLGCLAVPFWTRSRCPAYRLFDLIRWRPTRAHLEKLPGMCPEQYQQIKCA